MYIRVRYGQRLDCWFCIDLYYIYTHINLYIYINTYKYIFPRICLFYSHDISIHCIPIVQPLVLLYPLEISQFAICNALAVPCLDDFKRHGESPWLWCLSKNIAPPNPI